MSVAKAPAKLRKNKTEISIKKLKVFLVIEAHAAPTSHVGTAAFGRFAAQSYRAAGLSVGSEES